MGGRGATSGAGKNSKPHTYEDGTLTEQEYNDYVNSKINEFDDWVRKKDNTDFVIDGQIFEKAKSLKDMKTWFSGDADNEVPQDDFWAIQYNDGKIINLAEGDSTKGIKFTNVNAIIYDNASTTMVYAPHGIKFYNDADYEDYKKKYSGIWRVDFE